jgi:hypothetical protein
MVSFTNEQGRTLRKQQRVPEWIYLCTLGDTKRKTQHVHLWDGVYEFSLNSKINQSLTEGKKMNKYNIYLDCNVCVKKGVIAESREKAIDQARKSLPKWSGEKLHAAICF